jgi:hypothetical protein
MEFEIKEFCGNWIIQHKNGLGNLWKDGTLNKLNLGLDEALLHRVQHGEGRHKLLGREIYSLAPGYYRTYAEAKSYLDGYIALHKSPEPKQPTLYELGQKLVNDMVQHNLMMPEAKPEHPKPKTETEEYKKSLLTLSMICIVSLLWQHTNYCQRSRHDGAP